jgi:hypothetical protein
MTLEDNPPGGEYTGRPRSGKCKFCGQDVIFQMVYTIFQYHWEIQNPDGTPHRCLKERSQ